MPAGFELTSSATAFTNSDIFFRLLSKGILTGTGWSTVSQSSNWISREITFNYNGEFIPMICLHSPNGGAGSRVSNISLGQITFTISANVANAQSGTIEYFIFDTSPTPAGNSGFEMYKDGVRVFGSWNPVARPLGMYEDGFEGDALTGKKLGHVAIKWMTEFTESIYLSDEGEGICGPPPNEYQYEYWYESVNAFSALQTGVGSINFWTLYSTNSYQYLCGANTIPEGTRWRESMDSQYLIIDLTDL